MLFICASKSIAFARFASETNQLKFCAGIQHKNENAFFTLQQRLFLVIYSICIFLLNVSKVKTKNKQKFHLF